MIIAVFAVARNITTQRNIRRRAMYKETTRRQTDIIELAQAILRLSVGTRKILRGSSAPRTVGILNDSDFSRVPGQTFLPDERGRIRPARGRESRPAPKYSSQNPSAGFLPPETTMQISSDALQTALPADWQDQDGLELEYRITI